MHFFKAPEAIFKIELKANAIHTTNILRHSNFDTREKVTPNPSEGSALMMLYRYEKVTYCCHRDGTLLWTGNWNAVDTLAAMISEQLEWSEMVKIMRFADPNL
tara:strand:+ start:1774 stop:2082 length:309 start_codon:yes stop_codon:yes gene_type:complete